MIVKGYNRSPDHRITNSKTVHVPSYPRKERKPGKRVELSGEIHRTMRYRPIPETPYKVRLARPIKVSYRPHRDEMGEFR